MTKRNKKIAGIILAGLIGFLLVGVLCLFAGYHFYDKYYVIGKMDLELNGRTVFPKNVKCINEDGEEMEVHTFLNRISCKVGQGKDYYVTYEIERKVVSEDDNGMPEVCTVAEQFMFEVPSKADFFYQMNLNKEEDKWTAKVHIGKPGDEVQVHQFTWLGRYENFVFVALRDSGTSEAEHFFDLTNKYTEEGKSVCWNGAYTYPAETEGDWEWETCRKLITTDDYQFEFFYDDIWETISRENKDYHLKRIEEDAADYILTRKDTDIHVQIVNYEAEQERLAQDEKFRVYEEELISEEQKKSFKETAAYIGIMEEEEKEYAGYVLLLKSKQSEKAYKISVSGYGIMDNIKWQAKEVMNSFREQGSCDTVRESNPVCGENMEDLLTGKWYALSDGEDFSDVVYVILKSETNMLETMYMPEKRLGENRMETKGKVIDVTRHAAEYNDRMYVKYGISEVDRPKVRLGGTETRDPDMRVRGYHFIYAYTVDGVEYTKADEMGYGVLHPEEKIGEVVTVMYDADKPFNAVMTAFSGTKILKSLKPLGKILLIAGAVLLVLGAGAVVFSLMIS